MVAMHALLFPERNYRAASDHERTPDQDWRRWQRSEKNEIDDLPDHEERCDVEPNHLPKFQRSQVEKRAIAEKECRARHE